MLPSKHSRAPWILLIAVACLPASAQTTCSTGAITAASSHVNKIRHHLAFIKLEDMDTNVPAEVQHDTTLLKQNLANALQAILACEPTDAQPSTLQDALSHALKANEPEPSNSIFPWGGDLRVSVERTSAPQLLQVQLWFAIECGQDMMLLIIAPEHDHWSEKLLWQSPPYKDDRGAFGDFLLDTILPGKTPEDWRVIVAHGKPWCMSRFSGFNIDLLAPNPKDVHPKVLWHTERGYSRGDFVPSLKASGNIFEIRINEDEMLFNPDKGYERTVIYRYSVSGTNVTRLEPIATTGRGFVEEWLTMPWQEAKAQSLPTNSQALKRIHQRYETSYPENSNIYTSWTVGPVRSCSATGHFQVAFNSQHNKMIPGKPGGENDKPVPYYFQIKQILNGYELESATKTPGSSCHGPNLMPGN